MARFDERVPEPRRRLKIYASDPMPPGTRITIDIPDEELQPGPVGERFQVIDYDGVHECYYEPVDLESRVLLLSGGLEPTEADPRFHQQMVYGVAMRTLENFEIALGRRLSFSGGRRLRLVPHAFYGANAFFSPRENAIFFGYFRAGDGDVGRNLPGQNVFTCLSHDIIAHELSHAILHRLRRRFIEPTNPDVLAFHEAFSDIVALFQHFSYEDMLRQRINEKRAAIRESALLVGLAQQFGYATKKGRPLRSAIGNPDRKLYGSVYEPHARGAVLVAAVFDAYFATYRHRIADLIRIATGGRRELPDVALHPDLVNRIAHEAARTAQSFLTMCIRAFDYLPPVDPTFGDYLRAMITADFHTAREDPEGRRLAIVEAFRQRGIFPEGVRSLAEDSLLWEPADPSIERMDDQLIEHALGHEVRRFRARWMTRENLRADEETEYLEVKLSRRKNAKIASLLHEYATRNARVLGLDPGLDVAVSGFHPSVRVGPRGIVSEVIAQFEQRDAARTAELGGLAFRGGCTLVIGADGVVRYVIGKPIASNLEGVSATARAARLRLERQRAHMLQCDASDPRVGWWSPKQMGLRMKKRADLAGLCGGIL